MATRPLLTLTVWSAWVLVSFPERSNTLSRHYTGAQGGRKGRGLAIWPETGNKARAITLNVKIQSIARNEWSQSEVELNFVQVIRSIIVIILRQTWRTRKNKRKWMPRRPRFENYRFLDIVAANLMILVVRFGRGWRLRLQGRRTRRVSWLQRGRRNSG